MSTDAIADIVKQMQAEGKTLAVVHSHGEPVTIELRPKPRLTYAQAIARFVHTILSQNVRNN